MARVNKTDFVILGLLSFGPRSGYDIRKEVRESTGHFWSESYGQIYPALRRLLRAGLVRRREAAAGARRRHVYELAPGGRQALVRWLRAPLDPEPVRRELLLKLFFGAAVSPETLAGHVRAYRERVRSLKETVERIERVLAEEAGGDPSLPYWRMTLRHGAHASRAFEAWCDETLRDLERLAAPRARAGRSPVRARATARRRK